MGLTNEIPNILDYRIFNNGENISGGQRIRLDIVRALIRKKDIILANEITASLDGDNAKHIRQILATLPVIFIEVAHHIDPEFAYDQVIDLSKAR